MPAGTFKILVHSDSYRSNFGPSIGGDNIHITGTGFGASSIVTVTIDGIDCPVSSYTNTDIYW